LQLPHYPIFNIADSAIVSAAVLIAVLALRGLNIDGTHTSKDATETSQDATETSVEAPKAPRHSAGGHDV
jgi:signal peptidase II